jgi:hypothetical protein
VAREALASTLIAKLRTVGMDELAQTIEECATQEVYLVCSGCRTVRVVWNHCDNHLCPKCQPRLARNRYDDISFWAKAIQQPKHVVLTVKNQPWIDADSIRGLSQAFGRLRRRKFARHWQGGLWSIEVTNEGSGWHIHLHALIDAKWIDAGQLAQEWSKVVGQQFAIVKVKDARSADYVRECAKYSVKGTDLAKWDPAQLKEFITAVQKCRTFGTFGSLFKRRSAFTQLLSELRNARRRCECGCEDWQIMSKNEYDASFCTYIPPPQRRQKHPQHAELGLLIPAQDPAFYMH